jgi:hypothetical protein
MAHPKTIQKLTALLKYFHSHLRTEKRMDLSKTLRTNRIAADYGKLLTDHGVILKIDGGTRGSASYIWNKSKSPNEELSKLLIDSFNETRLNQRTRVNAGKISNAKKLDRIEKLLEELLAKVN